jgi:hypothetical protein
LHGVVGEVFGLLVDLGRPASTFLLQGTTDRASGLRHDGDGEHFSGETCRPATIRASRDFTIEISAVVLHEGIRSGTARLWRVPDEAREAAGRIHHEPGAGSAAVGP